MTYFEHLKKELYELRFFIPAIIIITALILYGTNSPHLFEADYWLRYSFGFINAFLLFQYAKCKYIQKRMPL